MAEVEVKVGLIVVLNSQVRVATATGDKHVIGGAACGELRH
jgi:hypothetical protein